MSTARPLLGPHVPALLLMLGVVACDKTQKVSSDVPTQARSAEPVEPVEPTPHAAPSEPTAAKSPSAPMPPADVTRPLARSSNAFGFDVLRALAPSKGNLAISPASISIALAMTWTGARGTTADEMRKVLHVEGAPDSVAETWGAWTRGLESSSRAVTFRTANRLYGESSYTFEAPYVEKTAAAFGAPLERVDFKTGFEPARAKINTWVSDRTETRIRDLLPAGALDEETRLVLVNAVYFLADWATPFDKERTHEAPFHVEGGAAKQVATMRATGSFRVAEVDGVKLLALPYKGGDSTMLLALPNAAGSLAAVTSSLTPEKIASWSAATTTTRALVALPRFEVSPSPSLDLGPILVKLGMKTAFARLTADFTGIANPKDVRDRLFVSKVFHKAFVKVDEKGTEAAAATAVVSAKGGGVPTPPSFEFIADHPFLFFVVDDASGLVLFTGRVSDPSVR